MDFLLIALLTFLNGLFAMSEMAVATSRKARLETMAEAGDHGASVALELQEHPTRFLSTVQVGITSIGVLNGIIGEAAFSSSVTSWFEGLGLSEKVAALSATAFVVTIITFVTIVFGELVPKRIGQMFPEKVARWISPPMNGLAKAAAPFVKLLSMTTQGVLKLVGLDRQKGPVMTHEEITASLAEGVDAGLIEKHEHQMVHNVFHLDDRPLTSMMTPREDVVFFESIDSLHECAKKAQFLADGTPRMRGGHSWYPVCRGGLDEVMGVVSLARIMKELLVDPQGQGEVAELVETVSFVPETLSGLELLEQFRNKAARMVLVVDEYGVVQGLLTLKDMLEAITGELKPETQAQQWAFQMPDGRWQLDGMMPVSELKARLAIKDLPDEDLERYNTLGGLLMYSLGRLPTQGDCVQLERWNLKVEFLQGRRIDRVLASKQNTSTNEGEET
jgi:putative hemolysin